VSDAVLAWLLDPSEPAVRAQALVALAGRRPDDAEVREARAASAKEGAVARLLDGIGALGDANALYLPKYHTGWHRLIALAEMGAPLEEPRVAALLEACIAHFAKPGGGFGRRAGHLCTTGNLVRAAALLGRADDPRIERGIEWLVAQQMDDGGWSCWPEKEPRGTLDAWEALAAFAALPASLRPREAARRGVDFFLERALGVGQGYAPHERIHFPRHYYYDALVGLDAVTALAPADPRLAPALAWLRSKRAADGRWRLDRQHPDYDDPDYTPYGPGMDLPIVPLVVEEAGVPSKWATLYAARVLARVERATH
jgi:hypothetical protein